jgi:enoyl-CoA hydratase/carnithine racemase
VTEGLRTELAYNVGTIRIEHQQSRNALTPELMDGLATELERLDAETDVRCILIAGTDEVFATGADIRSLSQQDPTAPGARFFARIAAIRTPIVAAVSGWALGPGCELALACDMLVAADKAQFGQPEVTLGVIPGGGATQQLARVIGKQKAMELVLTGRRFNTDQAYRWGLVNAKTKKADWLTQAEDLARQVAARAPLATQLGKQAILAAERESLDAALETERRLFDEAMATEDRIEAANAAAEGRPPQFEGR